MSVTGHLRDIKSRRDFISRRGTSVAELDADRLFRVPRLTGPTKAVCGVCSGPTRHLSLISPPGRKKGLFSAVKLSRGRLLLFYEYEFTAVQQHQRII